MSTLYSIPGNLYQVLSLRFLDYSGDRVPTVRFYYSSDINEWHVPFYGPCACILQSRTAACAAQYSRSDVRLHTVITNSTNFTQAETMWTIKALIHNKLSLRRKPVKYSNSNALKLFWGKN